jgi:hypothetical protein
MGPSYGVHLGFLRREVTVFELQSGSLGGWFESEPATEAAVQG